ncbi:MAG: polysaccharide biosynthesis/export family protein [Flavobacteriales bacterium]|nr:polysaccharide biosynthesis/export family protein [Flavobacteriales bacterium]
MVKKVIILLICASTGMYSCISVKKLSYLQNKGPISLTSEYLPATASEYHIQKGDILTINVLSADVNALDSMAREGIIPFMDTTASTRYAQGYNVNSDGEILFPPFGYMKISGMTLKEVQDTLQKRVDSTFAHSDVIITAEMGGITFSTLGEINSAVYTSTTGRLTIFEALAMAGDIRSVGNRMQVYVIRGDGNGVKVYTVDITNKNVISSPVYYIMPHDVIYISPLKQKSWGVDANGLNTLNSTINIFTSFISTTLSILALAKTL